MKNLKSCNLNKYNYNVMQWWVRKFDINLLWRPVSRENHYFCSGIFLLNDPLRFQIQTE